MEIQEQTQTNQAPVKTAEEIKLEHNSFIDDLINKVDKNNFNIYFYCPAMNIPSGGIGVLFKNAKILRDAGYNASIIYEPREDQKASYDASIKAKKKLQVFEPFNPSWMGKDILDAVPTHCIGEGEAVFNNGTKIKCVPLNFGPEDFLMIPEGFPNVMEKTMNFPCKRIILAQSWYYILNSLQVGQKWQHFGIQDVVSVSDGITEYINAIMPNMKIKQYSQSIDRAVFKNRDITEKNPVIAFSAGRTQDAVLKTYNVIKTFYSFYPQYLWIRFDELKGMSKEEYSERLSKAAIVLYTDEIAGFGTLPLEAMASGTHVVGWTPLGGKEYIKSTNGFWATNGDVFQLAELLGHAVEKWLSGKLDSDEVKNEYETTLSNYTDEKEKEGLIGLIAQYKTERTAEFNSLKQ